MLQLHTDEPPLKEFKVKTLKIVFFKLNFKIPWKWSTPSVINTFKCCITNGTPSFLGSTISKIKRKISGV